MTGPRSALSARNRHERIDPQVARRKLPKTSAADATDEEAQSLLGRACRSRPHAGRRGLPRRRRRRGRRRRRRGRGRGRGDARPRKRPLAEGPARPVAKRPGRRRSRRTRPRRGRADPHRSRGRRRQEGAAPPGAHPQALAGKDVPGRDRRAAPSTRAGRSAASAAPSCGCAPRPARPAWAAAATSTSVEMVRSCSALRHPRPQPRNRLHRGHAWRRPCSTRSYHGAQDPCDILGGYRATAHGRERPAGAETAARPSPSAAT